MWFFPPNTAMQKNQKEEQEEIFTFGVIGKMTALQTSDHCDDDDSEKQTNGAATKKRMAKKKKKDGKESKKKQQQGEIKKKKKKKKKQNREPQLSDSNVILVDDLFYEHLSSGAVILQENHHGCQQEEFKRGEEIIQLSSEVLLIDDLGYEQLIPPSNYWKQDPAFDVALTVVACRNPPKGLMESLSTFLDDSSEMIPPPTIECLICCEEKYAAEMYTYAQCSHLYCMEVPSPLCTTL